MTLRGDAVYLLSVANFFDKELVVMDDSEASNGKKHKIDDVIDSIIEVDVMIVTHAINAAFCCHPVGQAIAETYSIEIES